MQLYKQQSLFPECSIPPASTEKRYSRSGTFTDNMKFPVHRWFRYSAGFSAEWVEREILRHCHDSKEKINILDPFSGSGTTLLAAEAVQANAVGFEPHPFIYRVAKAKLGWGIQIHISFRKWLKRSSERQRKKIPRGRDRMHRMRLC